MPGLGQPWWEVREQRLREAINGLRQKSEITVVESIFSCAIENTIPGLNVIQAEIEYFDDPQNRADIYLNPGYEHNIGPLWNVIKTGRVGVSACWFWDNHHLFKSTMRASMVADVSFCAHAYASNYQNELGHYGGYVPLCGIFWSQTLVETVLADTRGQPRSDNLYGGYNCYPEFAERTVFLKKCQEAIPLNDLKFWVHGLPREQHLYYAMTHEQKLRDWCQYKVSLCVSFGSNMTMRIFEALVSGQIPIVVGDILDFQLVFSPEDEAMLPILRVPADDVEAIATAHREALARFDHEGQFGIDRRTTYALNRHMPRNRLIQMVEAIKTLVV